ncbi:MAG: UDP-N-acetylglucosamine--N-acetylmuramyl-(pentapeptide) pyrophosphoryl-undecaprenol N-acetylglucosamine transferase, partial [Verrucomicrobia bacterium]|nr:UDP-N-acetylglucosamine--N-acetylmuramyl-(pentapeptide) pyrophosphoryl-undecaprenol N-acetylglucosamine transferase [Verrucomicrobiota bacterium]
MKTAIACGGTGGHIFPGLATAAVLRRRGHEIELWLAGKDVEAPALRGWVGSIVTVPAEGLPSGFSPRAIQSSWKMIRAAWVCCRQMRERRPEVLLAMGSYASAGPVVGALRRRIPVVLHEANVLPGRAIRFFSRWADAVAVSFEETSYYLRRGDLVCTGMPMREDMEVAARHPAEAAPSREVFTVLVMGGSRGAHRLNEIASEAVTRAHVAGHRLGVVHLSGYADENTLRQAYEQAGVPHEVFPFTGDMASIYRRADIAVCRAGAATCAELSVFALPALLVPYPFAAYDHQTANARALEKKGAADVVPEQDLTAEWLADYLVSVMRNPGRLARQ